MRPLCELDPGDGNDDAEPPEAVEPEGVDPDGIEEPVDGKPAPDDGEVEPAEGRPAPEDGEDEPPEGTELPPLELGDGVEDVEPPLLGLGMPALPLEPLGELGEPALPESFPQPAAASATLTTIAMSVGRSHRAWRVGVVITVYRLPDFGLPDFEVDAVEVPIAGPLSSVKKLRSWLAMRSHAAPCTRAMKGSGTTAPMIADVPVTFVPTLPADLADFRSHTVAS
jgi:hypothetical protein